MKNRILLIRTGGTIDAEPYADPFNAPKFVDTLKGDQSLIMKTLQTLPNADRVDSLSWGAWDEDRFVKDSQKFTPEDISALADLIKRDDRRHFILTHGTDAMAKNAAALKEALKGTDKVVVFAGAMVPLSMADKHPSDGVESLRHALETIEDQPPGIYMAGRDEKTRRMKLHDPEKVEKSRELSKKTGQLYFSPC